VFGLVKAAALSEAWHGLTTKFGTYQPKLLADIFHAWLNAHLVYKDLDLVYAWRLSLFSRTRWGFGGSGSVLE